MSGMFQKGKAWGWAALLLLAIPAAQAQYNYMVENGTLTITKYYGSNSVVVISNNYEGTPITSIGNSAFMVCTSLTSVTMPNSITNIGSLAFGTCPILTNVIIGANVARIGAGAFSSCFSLSHISIPQSVTSIGTWAFQNCRVLTAVTIPTNVTILGEGAFSGCAALSGIAVDANHSAFCSTNGVLFNKDQTLLIQCPGGKVGSYSIPESVLHVGGWAFLSCTGVTNVAIPNSVTNIGESAFACCVNLVNVAIPEGVAIIHEKTFENCNGLTGVGLPTTLVEIGRAAFLSCFKLTNVTVPASVTNLEELVFAGCSNLTRAYFQGAAPALSGSGWFAGATNATVFRLPGAAGWPEVPGLWAGRPTALWLPETKADEGFGVQEGHFGFTLDWVSGQTIVVEACTNLADPDWTPVGTNTFDGDSTTFSDPEWTNLPGRFYRLCTP